MGIQTNRISTPMELAFEAERAAVDGDGQRPQHLLFQALKALVEEVERLEARIKELENWRTS